jgi:hypothetical protein
MCISLKHILVHLSCHSITKKPNKDLQSPFLVIDDNSTKIRKLSLFGLYGLYPTFQLYVRIWISSHRASSRRRVVVPTGSFQIEIFSSCLEVFASIVSFSSFSVLKKMNSRVT